MEGEGAAWFVTSRCPSWLPAGARGSPPSQACLRSASAGVVKTSSCRGVTDGRRRLSVRRPAGGLEGGAWRAPPPISLPSTVHARLWHPERPAAGGPRHPQARHHGVPFHPPASVAEWSPSAVSIHSLHGRCLGGAQQGSRSGVVIEGAGPSRRQGPTLCSSAFAFRGHSRCWPILGAFAPDWLLGAEEVNAAWDPTQGGRSGAPAPIWRKRFPQPARPFGR